MYPLKISKIVNAGILSPSPVKPDGKVNTCVSRDFFYAILSILPSLQNDIVLESSLVYTSSLKRRHFPHVHHGKPDHVGDTRPRRRQLDNAEKLNHTKSKTSTRQRRQTKQHQIKAPRS
jgi:hypothetical protein